MRKFVQLLIASSAMLAGGAHAATATGQFDVGITLNSACEVVSVPTIAFTYTSFQTGNVTPTSSFNIRCTATKSITSVRLDDGAGGIATGLAQSYTDAATGLVYTLTLSNVPSAGAAGGANMTINVAGLMAGGQAGVCNAATCSNSASTNKTRTITITY